MYIRTVSSLSKKTALPGSFSVSLTHFVNRRRLVRLYCLVHRPRLCSFSSALCIVQCPVGTPSLSSFLKRSKDLTLNSDFTELVHGVSSRHSSASSTSFLPNSFLRYLSGERSSIRDITIRKTHTGSSLTDFLRHNSKDRDHLNHDLDDDVPHGRRWSDLYVCLKSLEKIFHAAK